MSTWLPVVALLLAVGLTYAFCIRPMRRGTGCGMPRSATPRGTEADREQEIRALREEVDHLRQQLRSRATGNSDN